MTQSPRSSITSASTPLRAALARQHRRTVTDLDAAQHFYGTAFGWRFTDYAPAYAGIQAPDGDGEVGGLSLGQNVEPGGPVGLAR